MDVEDAEIGAESSINRDDEEDSAYVQSEAPRGSSPRATVEDIEEEDVDMGDPSNVPNAAAEALENAKQAADILDLLEDQAQEAYGTYELALSSAKVAEERSLVALYTAQTAKTLHERTQLSYHREAALSAEDKAVIAVRRSVITSKTLDAAVAKLKELLVSREQASMLAKQLGNLALQELRRTEASNVNIGAPPDEWNDEDAAVIPDIDLDCCCRRLLYNEPDFVNVPSLLETECNSRGFKVIFLPKFHCELNFIEQCWGYAKGNYRKFPTSSKEADLERNLIEALETIPLASMRR